MLNSYRNYLTLCKPRVVLLMLLTMWAGMYLSTDSPIRLALWIAATIGIAFMSGSAATLNHIIDHRVDAMMARTKNRPLPTGKISMRAACVFATMLGVAGFIVLVLGVNLLTAILTSLAAI